jgi:hypothetical protein
MAVSNELFGDIHCMPRRTGGARLPYVYQVLQCHICVIARPDTALGHRSCRDTALAASLKYNKHYIGIEVDGSAKNFVSFMPRKAHVIMTIKLPKTGETDEILEESGLETLTYETQWRQYRLRLDSTLDDKQREVILGLVKQASESFGKSS